MKNRCFSVCCAFAVLLTGGMILPAGAAAETESAGVQTDDADICEDPVSTECADASLSDDTADETEQVYTAHPFVSLFPGASPAAVASYTPPLHNSWLDEAVYDTSTYYAKGGGTAVLLNGTLYSVANGKATAVLQNVADYTHLCAKNESGEVKEFDIVLKKDGKLYANNDEIALSGIAALDNGYAMSAPAEGSKSRSLYALVPYTERVVYTKVSDNFDCFLDGQKDRSVKLFFNGEHCVYSCSFTYNQQGSICVSLSDVGIYYPVEICDNLYLDYRQNLLRLITEPKVEVRRVDNYVTDIEYIGSRDGLKLYRYKRTNNSVIEVLSDAPTEDPDILSAATLTASGKSIKCTISRKRTLTGVCGDKQFTVTNVETVLQADTLSGQTCVYFLRTDGSIWMYNFGTKACTELTEGSGSGVKGDINGDSQFNISDLTLMQRWINSDADVIPNWKSGDINKDNQLDAVDFALMKRDLIG